MSKKQESKSGYKPGDYVALSLDSKQIDVLKVESVPKSGGVKGSLYTFEKTDGRSKADLFVKKNDKLTVKEQDLEIWKIALEAIKETNKGEKLSLRAKEAE